MNWKQLLNIRGTNPWLMFAGLGWNLLWTFFTVVIIYVIAAQGQSRRIFIEIGLLGSVFLGPFLGGWFIGRVAADNRGATYGIVGSSVSAAVFLLTSDSGGTIGLMAVVVALAGGLNGGLLSQDRRPH